ncbi:NAD(+) diphosphatase [Alkalibacter rhizosphaerae]|uniref:NAD(+) diphosphatase n=1 Tax=Alkalibacter rhizosphaerae TaxID=2815577 RepID=A0A975AHZ5_9FIRM|nr:NAD(+) diphosphatase [Alkalibacter rhizosphaerae]QSX08543.1 NAD(+) diphosphatase [Alkalibacter rhizosphaerae]
MIQDIDPKVFRNAFKEKKAESKDLFLAYDAENVLVHEEKTKLWYPSFADFDATFPDLKNNAQFLFEIDDINYYWVDEEGLDQVEGWVYVSSRRFRSEPKYWRSFAGAIGLQLSRWYKDHGFCSRCGASTTHAENERMLYCKSCGFRVYPTISPCVIVGVHDGDRLLLTQYAGREHTRFALVAGFVEIGESLEEAVHREVMEEVGVRVKDLQFYKSQPWPFTDTILAGFFAALDGDDAITLQEDELALAVWMDRKDIPPEELKISLTGEMMESFRLGKV